MRKILNSSDLRNLNFIEYLYIKDDWVTLSIISDHLKCSSKSLRKDIPYLNEKFKPFKIETSVKKGIRLSIPQNLTIDYIYSITLNDSLEFKFLEVIFLTENLSRIDLEVELFISSSTISRIINHVSKQLNMYDIYISPHGYFLTGNEKNIQHFFFFYFSEKYLSFNYPFKINYSDIFFNLVSLLYPNSDYTQNISNLNLISLITTIRYTNGHYLVNDIDILQHELFESILENSEFLTKFKKITSLNLSYKLLCNYIYIYSTVLDSTVLDSTVLGNHLSISKLSKYNEEGYFNMVSELLIFLKNENLILNSEYLIIKKELIKSYFTEFTFILYDKNKFSILFLKSEYSISIQQLKKIINHYLTKYNLMNSENLLNRLTYTIITNSTIIASSLLLNSYPINIGISSTIGNTHFTLLKKVLYHHLKTMYHINSIEFILSKDELNAYDLILITNSDEITHPSAIAINPFPNNTDWVNIRKHLNKLV